MYPRRPLRVRLPADTEDRTLPSPFPGMDPWLEGYHWPDFHHRLAGEIARQLGPRLRPRYVARLEVAVVEDPDPETEVGILYPDVEVLRARTDARSAGGRARAAAASPLTIPAPDPVLVRLATVEIRNVGSQRLVTSIEILSPVNKRDPGLARLKQKWRRLREAGVHLIEIDLLRRGRRLRSHRKIPAVPYLAYLTRAGLAVTEVWPIGLRDPLPVIPVPLLAPDPDVDLDLGAAMAEVYDEAGYDLSIDYREPPPPPEFQAADRTWLGKRTRRARR